MSNRETFPAAQSPLQGDISGPAGATTVTVVGLQGIPVTSTTPADRANLAYNANDNELEYVVPSYTMGLEDVNGELTIISDDWEIYINGVGTEVLVNWPYTFNYQIFINGTGVPGSEQ